MEAVMPVDLRSDTLTRPSHEMRRVMADAEVGDDVFGEDPTVNLLQEKVADMLGKEVALFMASGTMANQVAINAHTQPGQEIILEKDAHIFHYEAGGPALLSGVQLYPIPGQNGCLTADQVEQAIRPKDDHYPQSSLVCLENTHNRAGGTIYPIEEIVRICKLAKSNCLKMHLDGARLWNACVARGCSLEDYARHFDSVAVCFSKGLGAPVGSMLAGSTEFIKLAHKYRKVYGGGMRQVGILAAAALYAVEHNFQRLDEDHKNAKKLAEAISGLSGIFIDLQSVQTNIIFIDVKESKYTAHQAEEVLKSHGLLVLALSPTRLRAVTHLDIIEKDIETAIQIFHKVFTE
jgi:threonine aldolase